MRSGRTAGAGIAVECKRYGTSRDLDQTELVGELAEAAATMPDLDTWILVANRAVPDQLYTALERAARRLHVEFGIVSAADSTPSTLETLCANAPELVRTFLSQHRDIDLEACDEELRRIRAEEGYAEIRATLKQDFRRSAAYEWWRREGHRSFINSLGSRQDSHAAFGQILNIRTKAASGRLVTRVEAQRRFQEWYDAWGSPHRGFVLLGEEGDGKTWAVASWLLQRCQSDGTFPPVLWLSAHRITSTNPRVLIPDALGQLLGQSTDYWSGRLDRWLHRQQGPTPACVLILDGLNERHPKVFWRELLQSLATTDWAAFAAVVVTTRTAHWEYFRGLSDLQVSEWALGPFDDAELDIALRMSGLAAADIPAEALALARKPRYFDLVVQHRDRLMEAGDVTVVRLIYEDWRDRFERKILPLDDSGFREMLKALARRALDHGTALSEREVADLAPFADAQATLSELATGGILVSEGGRLRVEPRRLQLGFGLLLADRLRNSDSAADADRLAEVAADWLEALPDIEIRAGICESAAFHTLSTPGFAVSVRATLLTSWLRARNQQSDIVDRISAYFPLDPPTYFAAAEILWTDDNDDPSAQQALMNTFARWSTMGAHRLRFVHIFERWLGFVHVDGSPRGSGAAERRAWQQQVSQRLGHELVPGPLTFGTFTLTVVEDAGLARLGRVALAVISDLEREPFLEALVIGSLAEAVTPERYDVLAWVIRASPRSLAADIANRARALMLIASRTALRAAYHLLTFEGSPQSIAFRDSLPEGLFSSNAAWEQLDRDPCTSGFNWTREDCSTCAGRDDINMFHLAQQIAPFAAEEAFRIPQSARLRLTAAASAFDVSQLHVGPASGEPDVRLDELEPGLAACAPEVAADVYRRLAREVRVRNGHPLMLVLFFLGEHVLILRDAERAVLLARWRELHGDPGPGDRTERLNEAVLVKLLLSRMTGTEQLSMLLSRRPSDLTLTALDPWICAATDDQIKAALATTGDPHELQRLLHFVAAQPEPVSPAVASLIAPFATQSDPWTRASALQAVLRSGNENAAVSVVSGGWRCRAAGHPEESHFGSLMLARYGHALTYDDLRDRIDPAFLGFAVDNRGLRPVEVERLALDIDKIWQTVIRDAPLLPPDFPDTELHVDGSSPIDRVERVGLANSALSQRITYWAPGSIWGGNVDHTSTDGIASRAENSIDDRLEELQRILKETLAQQRAVGNIWFGQRFSTHGLASVCAVRPDLLDSWLAPILEHQHPDHLRALSLARSFYESLCSVLLHADPRLGVRVYTALRDQSEPTSTRVGFARLHYLDISLFQSSESEPIVAAWQARLDQARSDADLLAISVLAQRGTASEWLERVTRQDLASPRPFAVARALALCGFVDTAWASEVLQESALLSEETWHGQVARKAIERQIRDRAAQYRFRQLMHALDDDHAWAGFRLLLRVVDRRIAVWRERNEREVVDSKRIAFVSSNVDRIAKAIEKNEDEFRKEFLGQRVREGQAWPWLDT